MPKCHLWLPHLRNASGFLSSQHLPHVGRFPFYGQDTEVLGKATCVRVPSPPCLWSHRGGHRPLGEAAYGSDLPLWRKTSVVRQPQAPFMVCVEKNRPKLPQIKIILLSEELPKGNLSEDNSLIWLPLLRFCCFKQTVFKSL